MIFDINTEYNRLFSNRDAKMRIGKCTESIKGCSLVCCIMQGCCIMRDDDMQGSTIVVI
jgi:hypothetical protein